MYFLKNFLLPFVFICFTSCLLFSQNYEDIDPNHFESLSSSTNSLINGGSFFINKEKGNNKVIGSPYVNKQWANGVVYMNSGKAYRISKINYNVYKQSLEAYISKDSIFTFNSNGFNKFKIGNNIYTKIEDESNFYKVLYNNNKILLLENYTIKINKTKFVPAIETEKRPDKLVVLKSLMVKKDNELHKIKLKRKYIIQFLNNKTETLQFAKTNKLSFKNLSDVIEILKYDQKKEL